jgi:hypothetical protein
MDLVRVGFRITGNNGFHITFENGWTVSVQFGPGNYCSHYDRRIGCDEEACGAEGSYDAECAIWNKEGIWASVDLEGQSDEKVSYRSTPKEVLKFLNWAASQEETPK